MKCFDCKNLLTEYIDGEVSPRDAELIGSHLHTCTACNSEYEMLAAEQEIFARYDRELSIPTSMWHAIEARTAVHIPANRPTRSSLSIWFGGLFAMPRYGLAGAMAVLVVGVIVGVIFFRTRPQAQPPASLVAADKGIPAQSPPQQTAPPPAQVPVDTSKILAAVNKPEAGRSGKHNVQNRTAPGSSSSPVNRSGNSDGSDVLFSDIAYSEVENKDTADHIAQAQNLLHTIRTIHLPDNDEEVDVTYEKAMSRRLLDENVVLRQDAEASGKYPVKALLSDLEPFLIEITNLPDKSKPSELRAIRDRVRSTEIVAALQSY